MAKRRLKVLAITAVAVALAWPAAASELAGCFARNYDLTHMAGHPDQQVTDMRLELGEGGNNQFAGNGFTLDVKTRTFRDWQRAAGTCSGSGGELLCTVSCHGGGIVVRAEAAGLILVDLEKPFGELALTACDGAPYATLDSGLDDKRFRLYPVACGR